MSELQIPVRHLHGNIIVGHGADRAASYRLPMPSLKYAPYRELRSWWSSLATLAFIAEADLTVHRVNRSIDGRYAEQAYPLADPEHASPDWGALLGEHATALDDRAGYIPEVYVEIALAGAGTHGLRAGLARDLDHARQSFEGLLRIGRNRPIPAGELAELVVAEEEAFENVVAALPGARRATTREVQWRCARTAYRGLGEPPLDDFYEPPAVIVENAEGEVEYRPTANAELRLVDAVPREENGFAVCRTSQGTSYQIFVDLGALPVTSKLRGGAELLSFTLEDLPFGVDAVMHVRWEGNEQAVNRVRRKVLDAANEIREEDDSEHGSLSTAAEKKYARAMKLIEIMEGEDQPPLLQITAGLAVGGASEDDARKRLKALGRRYRPVLLRHLVELQEDLWFDHFPRADGGRVMWRDAAFMTSEQFAAFMPIATHHAGSERGVHLGRIITGGQRSLLHDFEEAARLHSVPSWLVTGRQGSGKTMFGQNLVALAVMRGSLAVNVDPKGDHNLGALPEIQALGIDEIEMSGGDRFRGLLDPLVIAPADMQRDLASSFYWGVLPHNSPPEWSTHIRRAVRLTLEDLDTPPCGDRVVERLCKAEHADARAAGEALGEWGNSGLAALGFSDGTSGMTRARAALTTIRPAGLSLPGVGMAPADDRQRISLEIMRLLTVFAMGLIQGDRKRHKIILFDEAWFLLASPEGRQWLDRLNKMARYWNATLVLLSQQFFGAEEIEDLIGQHVVFGVKTPNDATRSLERVRVDPTERMVREMLDYEKGLGLILDMHGRSAKFQAEVMRREWLALLDTSPQAQRERAIA